MYLEGIFGTTDLLQDKMVASTMKNKITEHDRHGPMGKADIHGEILPHRDAGVARRCQ